MSKAASGNMNLQIETLDFTTLLRQTLADMEDTIRNSGFEMKLDMEEKPLWILSDGARLYRVLQNLLQNSLQYSLEGSKIRLSLKKEGAEGVLKIRNISREELPGGLDFTERFVRGDENRTTEGSGLGLSIAKSFTEACGGSFAVETQEDVFEVFVRFTLVNPPNFLEKEKEVPDETESISESKEISF